MGFYLVGIGLLLRLKVMKFLLLNTQAIYTSVESAFAFLLAHLKYSLTTCPVLHADLTIFSGCVVIVNWLYPVIRLDFCRYLISRRKGVLALWFCP